MSKIIAPEPLGILSIATNVYLDYWFDLARSLDNHVRTFSPLVLHVFTDQPEAAETFATTLNYVDVKVHKIEPLGWPEATLFRFKIFSEHKEAIREPFLMYLDADSIVDQDFETDLTSLMKEHGVLLVEQSGSWRPPRFSRKLRFYILHPGAVFADVRKLIWEGGLGTWEKRPQSTAFVPRNKRRKYVYGAIWMGPRSEVMEMIHELSARVKDDWAKGIVAVWHDESHMNWWNARYRPHLLDPRYYFVEGYHHLDELPSIVRLVAKKAVTR